MFTSYTPPFALDWEGVRLGVEKESGLWVYSRYSGPDSSNRRLLTAPLPISLQPVEPLNTPKDLTPFLMIDWSSPLSVAPGETAKIILGFPLEIGVFLQQAKKLELIDVFSALPGKYTLYGDPSGGQICKYWESEALSEERGAENPKTGTLHLDIVNSASEWIEARKAVFSAFGMKLFHGPQSAVLQAKMTLLNPTTAETEFRDTVPIKGLKRSTDVYPAKKSLIGTTKFTMREGL